MELEILEKTPNLLKFRLEGLSAAFVNALRRVILEEVPVLAIDECIIIENSSVVFDEVLAHKLGLIPLHTDLDLLVPFDECTCGGTGCPSCSTMLTLEKEGSSNGEVVMVHSGDLIPQNPVLAPISEKIPLAPLRKGQKIVLEAIAKLGRGKYHAKWQPVATVAYKNIPIIEIDKEKCDGCGQCVPNCLKQILEMKGDDVSIQDIYRCNMCQLCQEACDLDAIKVTPQKDAFIFWLEPTGALTTDKILEKALERLREKLTELDEKVKGVE
ncbi:MAG: DNA-directed RNA polymerase subunit D [Candidatus Heimdallarchaeota archaeon]